MQFTATINFNVDSIFLLHLIEIRRNWSSVWCNNFYNWFTGSCSSLARCAWYHDWATTISIQSIKLFLICFCVGKRDFDAESCILCVKRGLPLSFLHPNWIVRYLGKGRIFNKWMRHVSGEAVCFPSLCPRQSWHRSPVQDFEFISPGCPYRVDERRSRRQRHHATALKV